MTAASTELTAEPIDETSWVQSHSGSIALLKNLDPIITFQEDNSNIQVFLVVHEGAVKTLLDVESPSQRHEEIWELDQLIRYVCGRPQLALFFPNFVGALFKQQNKR